MSTFTKHDSSREILQTVHGLKNSFTLLKDAFERLSNYAKQLQTLYISNDFSKHNSGNYRERNAFLWLMIIIDGFYSKTAVYYILHKKAGIPFDLVNWMWAVDFIVAFVFAFGIMTFAAIVLKMGIDKLKNERSRDLAFYILGFGILLFVPAINIFYKLETDNTNLVLNIGLPILLYIASTLSVYVYADRTVRHQARDKKLHLADKLRKNIEADSSNLTNEAKTIKADLEQEAPKLSLFFSTLDQAAITSYLGTFSPVEKHILQEIVFDNKPGVVVSSNGNFTDLSNDEFVKFYKSL